MPTNILNSWAASGEALQYTTAVALMLAVLSLSSEIHAQSMPVTETLPAVGARVRVLAPRLGPEWQIGMFNRLRVEPPCYRIILFEAGPRRRIKAMLSAPEITRLQASTGPDGRTRFEPTEQDDESYTSEAWREVPMDALRAAERRCRVRSDPPPAESGVSP